MAAVLLFSLPGDFFYHKRLVYIKNKHGSRIFPVNGCSVHGHLSEIKKAISGFMKAQLLLVAMTMVLVLIGLSILKVDHAVVIAL